MEVTMKQSLQGGLLVVCVVVLSAAMAFGQNLSGSITAPYRIVPNITYVTANNYEAKLDVYSRSDTQTPQPTIIYIHGGGWTGGTKETQLFNLFPYLEMGWNAVNVEYRLARVSEAPAAVEDCLCALRWVIRNAKQYGFDTTKLVCPVALPEGIWR
jgi:acetyl esterase/lipase